MGFLLGFIAAFVGASRDLVSKKLSISVSPTTSAFATFAYAFPIYCIALSILWILGIENFIVTGSFWSYVFYRSLSDTAAESCKMHALKHGEISSVSAIISLHPVFTLISSTLLTNDIATTKMILGVLLSVSGGLIILFNKSNKTDFKSVIFALGSAIFFSINNCFDRLSVQTASPVLSAAIMTLFAAIGLIPTMIINGSKKELFSNYRPFTIRGIFEVLFMTVKLYALKFLQAPELAAIVRMQIIFAVVGGNVMFKEVNLVRKLIGALVTIIGVVVILI
jgi:drug/metabolite transporter (DMT)-like permease